MAAYPEASELPEIDIDAAIASMENDVEGYAAIADVFIEECAPTQLALERAVASGTANLLPILHEIANSLDVVGATQSGRMVRDLELRLHEGDTLDATVVAGLASRALTKAAQELRAWIADRTVH